MRTDAELVAATLNGDRAAFGLLVDRHRGRAVAVARGMLGAREDADDVVQEAVLQAFLGLKRLRGPDVFAPWLFGITANLARMRLRARRDVPQSLEPGGRVVPTSFEPELVEELDALRKLRAALEPLPPPERDAVLMHYVDGLTAQEIAALLGERPGTVRVRLHRARERLRRRLSPMRRELEPMVEVTVDDVVVRVVKDVPEAELRLANERVRVVVLKEKEGDRVLPIWVGPAEGDALALQLGGEALGRPLTADLMARIVEASGARIERVSVHTLREKTFYATVSVRTREGVSEVDARPSDALNLAARVDAPIFVDADLMGQSAFATAEMHDRIEALEREWGKSPEVTEEPSEWRSLSPEFVKILNPAPGRK